MSSIIISDIKNAGLEMFQDAETFMHDLDDDNLAEVYGGISPTFYVATQIAIASSEGCVVGAIAVGALIYNELR